MGSTVKITKSKNMSFKKLSFFYLVFILFLFFSSPGQYVVHFDQMRVTQVELNQRLVSKLNSYSPNSSDEKNLIETTLKSIDALDSISGVYETFAKKNLIYGDKLRENQFAEKQLRKTSLAIFFNEINERIESAFLKSTGKSMKTDILEIRSFTGQDFISDEFFFKETPNGVVHSILEHLKTVYLYNVITELFKQRIVLPKYEQIMLESASFIQKFKRVLVLGNSFDMTIKSETQGQSPKVLINGAPVSTNLTDEGLYVLNYIPRSSGKYSVEVNLGDKRLFTGFEVLKPEFRFVMEKSSFDAFVGEKMTISLDTQYFPSKNIIFKSDKAEIIRENEKLIVTPYEEGLFYLKMVRGEETLDEIALYAHEPNSFEVGLLDISGEKSSLKTASRLESLNTFWQVVSFRMTVVQKDGQKQILKSATRFLRNDLREAEQNAAQGSTLIFDEIKLIGRNRGVIKSGKPIVLNK